MADLAYDGFMSYSHAADGLLAPRLQAGLQRFAKPWWRRRAVRIFRDESSLSANPHLWSSITDGLDASGWFVLLLSPDAAGSEWVNQEVAYWVANRDPKKILPVVTAGEFGWSDGDVVGDAVPESLRGVFSEEPRWVDVRWARDEEQLDLQDPRFADVVADIASTIRGIPKDELASEEVRQHRRTVRTAWAAGGLVAVLAVAAVGFGVSSAANAREAERQAIIAEANAGAEAAARAEADANAEEADAQRSRAELEAERAGTSAELALARELAASAIGVVDEDPRLATWLALGAIDATPQDEQQPVEVLNALWRSVAADPFEAAFEHGFGGNTFVDISPDGSRLAVSSSEGATLDVVDAATLDVLWTYSEDTEDGFARPVFSPDGSMIAIDVMGSEAEDNWRDAPGVDALPNRVAVIDAATGEPVRVLQFPQCKEVWAPSWSPDGRRLAVGVGFPNGCVRDEVEEPVWIEIFDTDMWESLAVIGISEDDFAVRPIFLSDSRLGAFRSHGPLEVYDTTTFELVAVLDEVANPLVPAVSRSAGLIAAHSNETLLGYVYDLDTGTRRDILGQLEAWPRIPYGVSFSPDGRRVAFATIGGRVLVWDVTSGEQIFRLTGGAPANNAVFAPDGSRIYSAHSDGAVRVWNLNPGGRLLDQLATFDPGSFVNGNSFSIGREVGTVERFEFTPDFVAYIEFFSAITGELIASPVISDTPAVALPSDLVVVKLAEGDRFLLYDPTTGSGEPVGPVCDPGVCYVVRSADRTEFAIVHDEADGGSRWHVFDATTASSVDEFTLDRDEPARAFGSDWILLEERATAHVFLDRETGEERLRVSKFPRQEEISSDGRTVALQSVDNTFTFVDTVTWETSELDLGFGNVRGRAFGTDDAVFAVADQDAVYIVALESREIIREIPIPLVSDIHWINDSEILIGDRDGTVWGTVPLDPELLIERAREAVAERPPTMQECSRYRIDPCPSLEELAGG